MTDDARSSRGAVPVHRRGEHRWPMAIAALTAGVLHQFLPADFRVSPHWVYPSVLVVFLVLLVAGDPGLIDRDRRWLRVTTGLLIALITSVNVIAAIRLVAGILRPGSFDTAGPLLAIGAIVWLINILTFALWFWDLDGGGASTRAARGATSNPAFVFPEMTNATLVPATWYPQFVDYLALSFNTATAFGPTDVSAVKRWAKLGMIIESLISLSLAALVVARAINLL
ncbi:hypothetical protein [Pengzhenrongella frigida]|uniref:DUF1345 domain-containing protein n=1 Tax=Pengzhenrongella frigida TaxID=1259133 RepID=A0A4Q5N2I1_9MICO|nr:hypothetical protein [Cellulomonas sp. HLT2-17]RYV50797.1 hypothetical protein EUA98_11640 [Cellulomonas sp. HLT2-17]